MNLQSLPDSASHIDLDCAVNEQWEGSTEQNHKASFSSTTEMCVSASVDRMSTKTFDVISITHYP